MAILQDILYKVGLVAVNGDLDREVKSISFDSRVDLIDAVFVAVKGSNSDGHQFIEMAVSKGASCIVCEILPEKLHSSATYLQVKSSAEALGYLAANFYGNPSDKLKIVGITGTNGKTSTVTLLHTMMMDFGLQSGLLSTVVNKIGSIEIPSTHTTPDPVVLNRLLAQMVEEECQYCFMEVSSHAVHQSRIAGLNFSVAGFTNITHDHLDYHKTFRDYIEAKKTFFDKLPFTAVAITNIDDANGMVMTQNCHATVKTYALKREADYKVKILETGFSGLVLNINGHEVWTQLIGGFNAYNLLLVYSVARELGFNEIEVLTGLSKLKPVEGRFEFIRSDSGVIGIVDYAHTPDALKNVLSTIQSVRTRNEQLTTVVGCGGDRDRTKRPVMARIAAEMSDRIILTSDNPRSENPDAIIAEMKSGVPADRNGRTMVIPNREEAIKVACTMAQPGDILLIAGKGHEKYQEVAGVKHPFDDLEILKQTLKTLNK